MSRNAALALELDRLATEVFGLASPKLDAEGFYIARDAIVVRLRRLARDQRQTTPVVQPSTTWKST